MGSRYGGSDYLADCTFFLFSFPILPVSCSSISDIESLDDVFVCKFFALINKQTNKMADTESSTVVYKLNYFLGMPICGRHTVVTVLITVKLCITK